MDRHTPIVGGAASATRRCWSAGVTGAGSHRREYGVEGGEDLLSAHQGLTVAEEKDLAGDECLLSWELTNRNSNGGVPVLLHLHIFGICGSGTELGAAIPDLKVIRDLTLRGIGDHLGHPDAMVLSEISHGLRLADLATELAYPREREVIDRGFDGLVVATHSAPSLPLMIVDAVDESPHPGCIDEWGFVLSDPKGTTGIVTGHRVDARRRQVGYWWCLVREHRSLLHVVDWEVPLRSQFGLAKGHQLWAEILCEEPLAQWTIGNETVAVALHDSDDAVGAAHGVPTPVASDLEWYAAGSEPVAIDDGFFQDGVVHGVIEVAGSSPITVEEWSSRRWRRWWPESLPVGWASTPPPLDIAVAHTGHRAPIVGADGSLVDFVLVSDGWAIRRPVSASGELR